MPHGVHVGHIDDMFNGQHPVAVSEQRRLQDMWAADFESDGLVRNAFVCSCYALCLLQDLLTHLIKVEEAFACTQTV